MVEMSAGAGGQFLGERRRLTQDEHRRAVEAFMDKSPRPLTVDEKQLIRSTWIACAAFCRVGDYEGFDEAMAALLENRQTS
jgi:hypothetical protein